MTLSLIKALENLDALAAPGPWLVQSRQDGAGGHEITITAVRGDDNAGTDRPDTGVVATCPVRSMPVGAAAHGDADLIVELRNALPELLRLARLGLAADRGQAGR